MDKNKLIIIGLIIVIIALLGAVFVMIQAPAKESTKLTITSKNSLNEGDKVVVELTELNGTPIKGQTINITITDEDGTSDYHSVVTNEKGVGKLKLDKEAGKYTVNATYGGDEKHAGNSTTQKLKIEEEVVEVKSTSNTQYSSSSSSSNNYGPDVDSGGITREEAEKYGYTYTSEHGGHYIGSNDAWDEEAGVYHD